MNKIHVLKIALDNLYAAYFSLNYMDFCINNDEGDESRELLKLIEIIKSKISDNK